MRILAISDVHGRYQEYPPQRLPEADMWVFAGDLTNWGTRDEGECERGYAWLYEMNHRYQAWETPWIPGNHDIGLGDGIPVTGMRNLLNREQNFHGLRFFGVSMSPCYDMPELASVWTHMTARAEVEEAAYAQIPDGIDVLVSHCPPHGVLDAAGVTRMPDGRWLKRPIGSQCLHEYILRAKPKIVICGHMHGCAGHMRLGDTDVYNVAETPTIIDTESPTQ